MNWSKVLAWSLNIAVLVFIIAYVEGDLKWYGLGGFILFNQVLVARRMYQGREMLKNLLGYAYSIGKKHGGKVK